jgi:LysM repeat protein
VLLALAAIMASVMVAPSPTWAQSRSVDEYRVKPGDSLSMVARNHGVSTRSLAAENGISNLNLIRVGQVLRIPGAYHVVRPGDTLSGIAVSAGVSMSALAATNGIQNPDRIRIGQRLRLPTGSAARSVSPSAGYGRLPSRLRANPGRLNLIPSFEKWAAHYGVPADVLMAVAYRESGWQTSVASPKGAIGVGQLMPRTAEWIAADLIRLPGLDPYNPDDNIRMSARFLAWLIGYMGSLDAALAGYYQGPGSVATRGYYNDTTAYITNINQIRTLFRKG